MMQGDACNLGFRILNNAGYPVTPQDIMDLEITIADQRRTYGKRELIYENGMWFFPLTQSLSFRFWPAHAKAQVRVLWSNGVVEGKPMEAIPIRESISREVL